MKFLIWFGCILAYSLITTALRTSGILLGAIPTMILFGAMMWLAYFLCKKWDEHNYGRKYKDDKTYKVLEDEFDDP